MRTNTFADGLAPRRLASASTAWMAAMALVGLSATVAAADEFQVNAAQDQSVVSSFALDFGQLGGIASATITDTTLSVALDPQVASARLVSYEQDVEPIILPGGFSTGSIRVAVVEGSSFGTFDARTGEFNTTEVYEIHFTGDLSAFGLTSPVLLEGSSTGNVAVTSEVEGSLTLRWDGETELSNPIDPSMPIELTYACDVNTAFAPNAEQMLEISLIPFVETMELPRWLEGRLLMSLDRASFFAGNGWDRLAARNLDSFIRQVEINSRRRIHPEDAAAMINTAEGAMSLLQPTGRGR